MIKVAYAAPSEAQLAAQCLIERLNDNLLFPLITLMSAIAFVVFLWGCFQYVRSSDSPQGRETGQRHILYGLIGLLVMLSAFALLSIAAGTFGITDSEEYGDLKTLQQRGACANLEMQNNGGDEGIADDSSPINDDPSRVTDGPF